MKTRHLKLAMVSAALLVALATDPRAEQLRPGSSERSFAPVDLVGSQPAFADNEAAARGGILSVLEHYRRATEARALTELASVYAEFPPGEKALLQRFFENVKDLKVAIDNVDVAVVGDEAVVNYTRTDDFTDARSGQPIRMSARLTRTLRRQNGDWKIGAAK